MFKDVPYLLMIFGSCLITLGFFFPYFYLQLYADLHNLPTTFAFYTLTIQSGASTVGRILPNVLADKLGALNALILTSIGTGGLIFTMFALKNVGGVTAFAIFYGFFSGAVLSLFAPVLVGFAKNISEVGVRMGIAFSIASLAWLTGPPIAGAILSNSNHWARAIIFSGVLILASGPILLVSRHGHAKRKKTPYV